MFYNKLNKWISILLCTSICIGSSSITSVANSISATASPKMETLDNETSSIAETFAIEASESSEISDNEISEAVETSDVETSDTSETPDVETEIGIQFTAQTFSLRAELRTFLYKYS